MVENCVRGVARRELIETLIANEVPPAIAIGEVDAILGSPALAACIQLAARARRLDQVLALQRKVAADGRTRIERRARIQAEELFDRYWATSRPVILTEMTSSWPARTRWTPAWLRERFGQLEVEVMSERDADPRCDENFESHRTVMRLADYVDRILAGTGNDLYMVAHNGLLDRPGFEALLDDVVPDEEIFDRARLRRGGTSFWLGAAGTRTPIHHDTTNILFCQMHGRKRVSLIAPTEVELLERARGFYVELHVDDDAFRETMPDVVVLEEVLEPGEALFLPAGWWHQIVALDTSISFSLLAFRRPNAFSWYRPGFPE